MRKYLVLSSLALMPMAGATKRKKASDFSAEGSNLSNQMASPEL